MSKTIDVEMTVGAIDSIADDLEHCAKAVRRISKTMKDRNDITYASEVMVEVRNCYGNLRLDLLVTRPLREYQNLDIK